METFGQESSYVTSETSQFIYFNCYLSFKGLTEDTAYVLYFLAQDLSKNISPLHSFSFRTLEKHQPAHFSLVSQQDYLTASMLSVFGILTGLPSSRFEVLSSPPRFSLPATNQPALASLISSQTTTYKFRLLQTLNLDHVRPIDYIQLLQTKSYLLLKKLPSLKETE